MDGVSDVHCPASSAKCSVEKEVCSAAICRHATSIRQRPLGAAVGPLAHGWWEGGVIQGTGMDELRKATTQQDASLRQCLLDQLSIPRRLAAIVSEWQIFAWYTVEGSPHPFVHNMGATPSYPAADVLFFCFPHWRFTPSMQGLLKCCNQQDSMKSC